MILEPQGLVCFLPPCPSSLRLAPELELLAKQHQGERVQRRTRAGRRALGKAGQKEELMERDDGRQGWAEVPGLSQLEPSQLLDPLKTVHASQSGLSSAHFGTLLDL